MGKKSNINFHQTFKPEISYIANLLEISDGRVFKNLQEISAHTGIPQGSSSGKVEPHLNYVKYMGLIEFEKTSEGYLLNRTDLGNLVYNEDPGLHENLTLIICHCMISRRNDGAEMWKSLFLEIMPKYNGYISKEYLLEEMSESVGGKVTTKNISPLLNSYSDMFEKIEILKVNGDLIELGEIKLNREFIFVFAWVLQILWNEQYKNQNEISSLEFENLRFGNLFGWGKQKEYEVLERLNEKGLIRMNRQLVPYTIYRIAGENELLPMLYSELF